MKRQEAISVEGVSLEVQGLPLLLPSRIQVEYSDLVKAKNALYYTRLAIITIGCGLVEGGSPPPPGATLEQWEQYSDEVAGHLDELGLSQSALRQVRERIEVLTYGQRPSEELRPEKNS